VIKMTVKLSSFWNDWLCLVWLKSKFDMFVLMVKKKLYHQNQHYVGHMMYLSHDTYLMKFSIWLIWFNHLDMTDNDCNVIFYGVTILK
jgi:hypothetical protein